MRETHPHDAFLNHYARSLIRIKARQLTRYPGFTRSDQKDLEQELWTMLLAQADQFDPDRASINTFIACVVNASIRMILRDSRRECRAEGLQAQSLDNGSAGPGDSQTSQLSEADLRRRHSMAADDEQRQREDREAIEFALSQMPDEVRAICRHNMGGTVHSASYELGISRRQIRNKLDEARRWLNRAGFSDS